MWRREGGGKKGRCEGGKRVLRAVLTAIGGGNGDNERGHDERFGRQTGEYEGWVGLEESWKDGDEGKWRRENCWE